jgi:hypothetical protein
MKKLVLLSAFTLTGFVTFAQEILPAQSQTEPKYELVERNRRGHFISGDAYIKQDGVTIANYITEELSDGQIKYTFTLPNGTVVAIGMMKQRNMGKLVVETMIDKKKHTVGLKNLDETAVAREIGMFLSDNKYI